MQTVTRDAMQRYDRWSAWYDYLASAGEARIQDAGIRHFLDVPGRNILDLGCGTGTASLRLASQTKKHVLGVDISYGMLHRALKKRSDTQATGVELVQGDAFRLPLAASSVDAVLLSFTLELFPETDIPTVLHELERVCVTGGVVVIIAMAVSTRRTLLTRLYRWLHDRYPDWIDCRPIDLLRWLPSDRYDLRDRQRHSIAGLPVDVVTATLL